MHSWRSSIRSFWYIESQMMAVLFICGLSIDGSPMVSS